MTRGVERLLAVRIRLVSALEQLPNLQFADMLQSRHAFRTRMRVMIQGVARYCPAPTLARTDNFINAACWLRTLVCAIFYLDHGHKASAQVEETISA